MYAILALFHGCTGDDTGTIPVKEYDCELQCWEASTDLEVSGEYWSAWLEGDACDDEGVIVNYDGVCVQTSDLCDTDFYDDPKVGEVADCCGGIDPDVVNHSPACVDL